MLFSKIDSLTSRLEATNARIETVSTKVDSLKNNEVEHLNRRLEEIRIERRQPWTRKQWLTVTCALITACTAIILEIIRGL